MPVSRPPRVLMVSAEVESFARTGGLGDVVLGLSRALAAIGVETVIATPLYGVTHIPNGAVRWTDTLHARTGWGERDVRELGVIEARVGDVRVCLLEHNELFGRQGIYGDFAGTFGDNELRYATLSRGALALAERLWGVRDDEPPSFVIHAHDWHAALAVITARLTMGEAWRRVPSVFTIHNLAYQGVLGEEALDRLALPRNAFNPGCLEEGGAVNLLKGAISLADRVTTVSPTYAREILSPRNGFGLDYFLRAHHRKLRGIVNGIDVDHFGPESDGTLVRRYRTEDAVYGKRVCKEALFADMGLDDPDAPLVASVSRLTAQKGIEIFLDTIPAIVARGARVLVVGTGDARLERGLRDAQNRFPGRVSTRIAFDENLARRVYAGSDFFVVPSRYEPCGLTQLYAMRYGSIPVVTDVGGLHDTVLPFDGVHDRGTGFVAASVDSTALLVALEDALNVYRDEDAHGKLITRAMSRDSSWTRSAKAYVDEIYDPVLGR
ncbi:MAG: glycogen/starch synthase [Polyangiaceae bacterium]